MLNIVLTKSFNKKDFKVGASTFKVVLWYFTNTFFFRTGLIPFSNVMVFILRLFGAKIGRDVRIKPFIHIKYPWKLSIGNYSWLAECYIENLVQVTIGNHVCISQKSMLLTGSHNYKTPSFDLMTKEIVLEDGVWIGAGSVVCPGVVASSHAILTVGSIATTNMASFRIYQGNPAVEIRKRNIL